MVARAIEATGIPTVFLSGAPEVAEATKPPRTVAIRYPLGRICGRPFHVEEQRQILLDTLDAALRMTHSGEMFELAYRWTEDGQIQEQ